MWAYRGQLPAIQDKRNQTIPALMFEQIKAQSLIEASIYNCYTMTERIAIFVEIQEWEKRLDYRE